MSRPVEREQKGGVGWGCIFVVILALVVLIAVVVSVFTDIANDANIPGAEMLRSAREEVTQRLEEDSISIDYQSGPDPTEPPVRIPTRTSTPSPTPRPTHTPTATPGAAPGEASTPQSPGTAVPATTERASLALQHYDVKLYMLQLINEERTKAGVPPVALGNNIAAQLHAEASLANCFAGHWGLDGLKPYMRYSLAGGYQSNGENSSGADYCVTASDQYRALVNVENEVQQMMDGWMGSPGHRRNILDKWHRKVSIGLAWDRYNMVGYQHFEGEYTEYIKLPEISNGILSLSGTTRNGLSFSSREDFGVQIFYDPPPQSLTRGQVSHTFCYSSGIPIADLRYPSDSGSPWTEHEFTKSFSPCLDPYTLPPESPAPGSYEEARIFWERARDASRSRQDHTITVPWVTASDWVAEGTAFSVTADISPLLSWYGPGVYTVLLWGVSGTEDVAISEYSIFHQVEPPDTYNPGS